MFLSRVRFGLITALVLLVPRFAPADEAARLDAQGDPLPPGARARLGTVRLRKGFLTYRCLFSPDGTRVAAVGAGQGLCVWDAATGKEWFHAVKTMNTRAVAYSPDGKWLACGWRAAKGSEVALVEVSSGELVRTLGRADPASLAFSPDGKRLAMGGDSVTIWSTNSGQLLHRLPEKKLWLAALVFAPDGKILAGVNQFDETDGTIHRWDTESGKTLATVAAHTKALRALAFRHDGRLLASGGDDEAIRLWDATSMKAAQVFEPHAGPVHAVAFSPDDAILVSGHQDGTIILWDSKTSKELRRWQAHASQVHSLSFAPDGKIIASAATWDSGPRLWDTATGSEKLPLPGHRGVVDWLEFAPDATKLFSIGRERTLLEWDLPSSRAHPPVQWKFPGFAAFTLSRDRQTLASLSYADGALQIWDARGKSAERTLAKYPGSHRQTGAEVRFSPDDKLLACACKESVEIWDRAAGKMLRRLPGYPHGNHIAFSPDGKVLACTEQAARLVDDSLVHLWDVETGRELRRLDTMHALGPIAFSPDGRWLAAGGGWPFGVHGPVQVWNLGDGKTLSLLDPPDGAYGLAFSADGRFLAVAGIERDGVRVLDLQTRKQACHFDGQEYSTVAFAPDGRSLATGCNDGSILVWDLEAKHLGPTRPAPVVSTRSLLAAWQPRPPFRYPEARHGKGELKYINGIPVLTLAGTPEEIGTQMGVLALKPALVDFDLDQFMRESLQSLGPDKSGPWVKLMAQLLVQRYPREYRVELEAMARAAGMDFDFLVLANVLPDLGLFGCSTLLVDPDRSATGKVLFGRNMDFPPRAGLDRMSLLLIYRPDGKPPFASVGFPGVLVGTSTMNAAGLAWTVNSIYSAVDGSGRFNPLGTPLMVWLRQMAEQCADSAAAEKLIRPLTRTGMLSLSVCDKTGGGVFEITPRSLAVRRGDKGLCLCTNHFLTKGLATDTGCWRYPRLAANQKLDKLSCDDIARSLHAVNQGRWTIQTMIFEPADLKLHLAVGRGPVSALPLQQLDLAPLLGR